MRWFLQTPNRRLWLIALYGTVAAIDVASFPQPIVGTLIESVIFLAGALLALIGLFGHGPLRARPDPVVSDVDQLVYLAQLARAGEISHEEFDAAKKRIIGR